MTQQTFEAPALEHLAELLPNFEFTEFIAQGGMGAVYRARQKSLDRDVAIKILPREVGDDEEFRISFETEAKAMARLNHPNLVGVYDFGDVDGMPYIVMEYVDGNSLYSAAQGQPVDPVQAVDIILGVCRGIAHAHDSGVIHRDLKPANILLTLRAESKIGDFGLARPEDHKSQGLYMGTPGYAAPEVFNKEATPDSRVDIYSIGIILHELLTGVSPDPSGKQPTEISGYPKLDVIWRKATNPNPALRYQTAEELGNELEAWRKSPAAQSKGKLLTTSPRQSNLKATGLPAATRPIASMTQLPSKSGSSWMVIIVLMLAVGAAAWLAIDYMNSEDDEVVETPAEPQREARDDLTDLKALLDQIRNSLDKEAPLFPVGTVEKDGNHYFVIKRPLTKSGAEQLASMAGGILATPATSEEAKWLGNLCSKEEGAEGFWLGAHREGDEWFWHSGESWEDTMWADNADPATAGSALVHAPDRGWMNVEPSYVAAGAVIEWGSGENRLKVQFANEVRQTMRDLLAEASRAAHEAQQIRDKALEVNAGQFNDSLDQWLESADESEADRYRDDVDRLKDKVDDFRVPDLQALRNDLNLDLAIPMAQICVKRYSAQNEIDSNYQATLEELQETYLQGLAQTIELAEEKGRTDLVAMIEKTSKESAGLENWIKKLNKPE